MHLTKLIYACTHTPAPAAVAAWQASPETAHPWAYAHPPQSYGQDELEVTVWVRCPSRQFHQPINEWAACRITRSLSNSSKGMGSWSTWSLLSPRAYQRGERCVSMSGRFIPVVFGNKASQVGWKKRFRSKQKHCSRRRIPTNVSCEGHCGGSEFATEAIGWCESGGTHALRRKINSTSHWGYVYTTTCTLRPCIHQKVWHTICASMHSPTNCHGSTHLWSRTRTVSNFTDLPAWGGVARSSMRERDFVWF